MTPAEQPHDELIAHLIRTSPLSPGEARRVVADVLAYLGETTEEFVRRRHAELRVRGVKNDRIFALIAGELPHRRFAAPELSTRQLRRIVYG